MAHPYTAAWLEEQLLAQGILLTGEHLAPGQEEKMVRALTAHTIGNVGLTLAGILLLAERTGQPLDAEDRRIVESCLKRLSEVGSPNLSWGRS